LADADVLAATVAKLCTERQRLYTGLCHIPYLKVYPSQANFILCKVEDPKSRGLTALAIKTGLAAQGILVRYYHTPLLQDCFRASVGFPEYTERLLAALEELA
jgi:histidinol-phosphate aminotransferase